MDDEFMNVVFFHRKPNEGNFSIENLFKQVRSSLPDEVTWHVKTARFHSKGFFRRLFISIDAFLNQGDVNHITGDINFLALFLSRKKTVLTIHDIGFMEHSNPFYKFILLWFWIKFPVNKCALITTVSEATKFELLKYTYVAPHRIHVIYVPISRLFVSSPRVFNSEQPRILQIGTKQNKNVVRLVQALQGIQCIFEIIGEIDETLKEQLEKRNVRYSNSKNLTDEEVFAKYKSADIISFVSTYEGFGMPIIEANTVGRVVITSNILSMPEVAGNAAHLVDPFSVESIHLGIKKLINDSYYRDKLITNGYLNAKRFSEEKIAFQYTALYRQLNSGKL